MKTKYTTPDIDILLFDEEEVLADSTKGVTAAEDVKAQMEHLLGRDTESQKSGSITTIRLEDINTNP